jgi:AcrR family transcriptional regulator
MVQSKVEDRALVEERHAQLIAAATKLFLGKGFHQTSVREIAAAVGWTMGSLYLYIARKEDVLFLVRQAILDRLIGGLDAIAWRGTARETLRAYLEHHFRTVRDMRDEVRLFYREFASMTPEQQEASRVRGLELVDRYTQVIRRGVEAGEFRPVIPEHFASNAVMVAHRWVLGMSQPEEWMPFEEYVQSQIEWVFTGLDPARTAQPSVPHPGDDLDDAATA